MNTYCYRHGLVHDGCGPCEADAYQAIRNGYPLVESFASLFPQVGAPDDH